LYAYLDQTGPAGIERYLNDDLEFSARTTRFLTEHRVAPPVDPQRSYGTDPSLEVEKIAVLAAALTRAVSRARDNELYVILADLVPYAERIEPLIAASRMAQSRHHQVLVLVPWPADMPTELTRTTARRSGRPTLETVVRSALVRQHHKLYAQLKSALAKAGVRVIRISDSDPVPLVLDRLDRLRGTRVR
jgi:hypothetical protein